MTFDDNIRAEKLQYDFNREVAKISRLSSGKNDKNEYVTDKECLPQGKNNLMLNLYSTVINKTLHY